MNFLFTIFLLFAVLFSSAQKDLTFKEVAKTAKEIRIVDSFFYVDYSSLDKAPLDTTTGSNLFQIIYRSKKQTSQETDFFIAGKITSHKIFDILLLCVERSIITKYSYDLAAMPIDRSITKELFFVLLDKEGNYKNSFLAAMDYRKKDFEKNITREISSWVYNNFKIIQNTKTDYWPSYLIYLPFAKNGTKEFNFSMEYRINDYGVFVAYPTYKSN